MRMPGLFWFAVANKSQPERHLVPKRICVFSSSSNAVAPAFFAVAAELGAWIGRRGDTLVYGGATVGLMGAVARAVHTHGGRVVGVIPEIFHAKGLAYEDADELLVVKDLRARKAAMEERADVFIALPGGFGTLEEMLEILTLKQIHTHSKPLIFLNPNGFYQPLLDLFERIYAERFARPESRELYFVAPDVASAFSYLDAYHPPQIAEKWL